MKRLITLFTLLTMFAIGAQAQIVGANEGPKTSSNTSSSLYKPTGHYLRFEAGWTNFISVAYGYQINPYIMVGGGAGYGYFEDDPQLPIYAEAIFSTPRQKWSFIGNFKIGINPFEELYPFFIDPRIGFSYKNFGVVLGGSINFDYFTPDFTLYYNIPLIVH